MIFQFTDYRIKTPNGNLKGTVVHNGSGDIYGGVYGCDSDNKIRLKCASIFFVEPLIVIGRVAFRALVWIPRACWEGHDRGLKFWEDRRVEILRSNTIDKKLPGKADLALRITSFSLCILGRDLLKIIAIPFAALYTMVWCVGSLAFPLMARREIAKVEEATYVELGNMIAWWYAFHVVGFIAPCMPPKRVWDEHNLYRIFPDSSPKTIRSQLLLLQKQISSMGGYFDSIEHQRFTEIIQSLRGNVKTIAPNFSDGDEYELIQKNEKKPFPASAETLDKREVLDKEAMLAGLNDLVSAYRKELASIERMPSPDQSLDKIRHFFGEISKWIS